MADISIAGPARPARASLHRAVRYAILAAISIVFVVPFALAFLGTFKTNAEITAWPPSILPAQWLYHNWVTTWNTDLGRGGTFPRWLFNTAFLSLSVALCQVLFSSAAGYAFARLRFRGKEVIFAYLMATMMLPGVVLLVPKYVLMSRLHLVNTFWAIIIPGAVDAASIFMMTQYFKSIPHELEESCMMDGASFVRIFSTIIIPLSQPAILTLFILRFQGIWNNFLDCLLYLTSVSTWTLNVALMTFQQQYKAEWNLTLVGAMFNAIPILVIFFVFSRYYVEGVSYSGLKA
jgi:ABC-type glycerol-3-phosphate transport system permease component